MLKLTGENATKQRLFYNKKVQEELSKLPQEGSIYLGDIIEDIELDRQDRDGSNKIFVVKWCTRENG